MVHCEVWQLGITSNRLSRTQDQGSDFGRGSESNLQSLTVRLSSSAYLSGSAMPTEHHTSPITSIDATFR